MPVVKGEAFYAMVQQPNMNLDHPGWCADVIIDQETYNKLYDEGMTCIGQYDTITVTDDKNHPKTVDHPRKGEYYFRVVREVETRKTKVPNQPPLVVDAKKRRFTDLIGNGSIIKVQYRPWSWEYKNKKGISADLVAVQVLELVPYGVAAGSEFEEEEGYDSSTSDITYDRQEGHDNSSDAADDPPF